MLQGRNYLKNLFDFTQNHIKPRHTLTQKPIFHCQSVREIRKRRERQLK